MPRGRALRALNVNPDTMQKPADLKTVNAAFSCTENNVTGNKRMSERSFKNAQSLKENKLVKQIKQEALIEQQAASTSKLDPPSDCSEKSESANIGGTEDSDNDIFPPFCAQSDTHGTSHTPATVENAPKASGSLTSSSNNIVADLHEKLCSSREQNKKRANRKRSQSTDTDDSLPLLNTIVNEILSLEADFPLPSTSSVDTHSNKSTPGGRKRSKRHHTKTTPKRNKKRRRVSEDLPLAPSAPSALVDLTTTIVSDSDSDCEITAYIPSNSQQVNVPSEIHSRDMPDLDGYDQSVLELNHTPVPQSSEDTDMRLDSIINMLNDTIQRVDEEVLIIDNGSQRLREQAAIIEDGTNFDRSVIEIVSVNARSQLTPPVIVVSDDENEPSMKAASSKELKSSAGELPSQQGAASSKGRKWECPICWEKLTSARGVSATMCGHVFCNPCINHVLKTAKKCPMCRKSLTKKKVHPLFLEDQ